MKIKERIKEYLEFKGLSKYHFYKKMGFSNGFLDKEGSIGSDKCEKIIYEYSDLNIEWLLTGNGPMLKNEYDSNSNDQIQFDKIIAEEPADYTIQNPYFILYKEKDKEVRALSEELGVLKERIRQLEADRLNDQNQDADTASTKKLHSSKKDVTSANVHSK